MLHARLEVAQILDMFQVRVLITEFAPGTDPVHWVSEPQQFTLDDSDIHTDALSTVLRLIALWSERTISD